VRNCLTIQWQIFDSMLVSACLDELIGGRGQWKLADLILDQNFLHGDDAQVYLV